MYNDLQLALISRLSSSADCCKGHDFPPFMYSICGKPSYWFQTSYHVALQNIIHAFQGFEPSAVFPEDHIILIDGDFPPSILAVSASSVSSIFSRWTLSTIAVMGWTYNAIDPNVATSAPIVAGVGVFFTILSLCVVSLRLYVLKFVVKVTSIGQYGVFVTLLEGYWR